MKQWKAEVSLFAVTCIWGCTFLFTKEGIADCSPSLYVVIRFSVALLLCLLFFFKKVISADRQTIKQAVILGIFFGSGFILQTYGLKFTTVSKSAFITGTCVLLTPFVFWIVERKKIFIWQKLGVVIAAIGLWLFTNPDFDNINWGDVMTLGSTLFWAIYITYMDVFTRDRTKFDETIQMVSYQFVGALPVVIISYFLIDFGNTVFVPTNSLIVSLIYNAIIASFIVTCIHTGVQKFSTPVKAALIFSFEPIVASFFAWIMLSEVLNSREIIGGVLLFMGILAAEVGEMSLLIYIKFLKLFKKID